MSSVNIGRGRFPFLLLASLAVLRVFFCVFGRVIVQFRTAEEGVGPCSHADVVSGLFFVVPPLSLALILTRDYPARVLGSVPPKV